MSKQPKHKQHNRNQKAKFVTKKSLPQPSDGTTVQEKLALLPKAEWDNLRAKGFAIPEENFSNFAFVKNRLPFSFVYDLSTEAKKKLFIRLVKSIIPNFTPVVCKNWADGCLTIAEQEVLHDIAAMMDEDDYNQANKPKAKQAVQGKLTPVVEEKAVV